MQASLIKILSVYFKRCWPAKEITTPDKFKKDDFKFIVTAFIVWRLVLQVIYFFGSRNITLQEKYLGGGIANFSDKPWLWSWANFDGLHYFQIATEGYNSANYFFFPLYPMAIRLLTSFFWKHRNSLCIYWLINLQYRFFSRPYWNVQTFAFGL